MMFVIIDISSESPQVMIIFFIIQPAFICGLQNA